MTHSTAVPTHSTSDTAEAIVKNRRTTSAVYPKEPATHWRNLRDGLDDVVLPG